MNSIEDLQSEGAPLFGSEHKSYYPALDGLRAIAVMMGFGDHINYLPMGWIGVDIFFVLSGFLITGILWNSRNDAHRFKTFYVRRGLRIFPVDYAVWLTFLLTTPLFHFQWDWNMLSWPLYVANCSQYFDLASFSGDHEWGVIIAHLLFEGRYHSLSLLIVHFWSLCVEEQFYLLWPLAVFFLGTKRRILIACAVAVACVPALRIAAYFLLPKILIENDILYFGTVFRADALLLGGFFAILRTVRPVERFGWRLLSVSGFCLAAMYGFVSSRHPTSWAIEEPWISTVGFTFVDLAAASLVLLALDAKSFAYRLLSLKPLRWLGVRSYGFYIFHFPVLSVVSVATARLPGREGEFIFPVASFLVTLGLSALSFRYLEKPFLRMKDRFVPTPIPSESPA